MLGKDALQAASKVPIIDLVEALQTLKTSAQVKACILVKHMSRGMKCLAAAGILQWFRRLMEEVWPEAPSLYRDTAQSSCR